MFASWFMLLPCVWVSWTCWFSILCISSVRRSSTPSCRVMSTYPCPKSRKLRDEKEWRVLYCGGIPLELEECSALGISPQHLLAGYSQRPLLTIGHAEPPALYVGTGWSQPGAYLSWLQSACCVNGYYGCCYGYSAAALLDMLRVVLPETLLRAPLMVREEWLAPDTYKSEISG